MIYGILRCILREWLLVADEDRLQEVVVYLEDFSRGAGARL